MSLVAIHPSLPDWIAALDLRLHALFEGEYTMLHDASVSVVGSRGKRLRPALLLLANACFADIDARSINYAAMVELIHAASLVHDDVVDEADSRRGQPTAHVRWGNKYSVLLGDYLLARVFEIAAVEAVPAILRLVAATATDMGRAVTMELTALHIRADEATYWEVIRGKTATLFGASAAIGGVVGHASPAQQETLYRLGAAFGYAFQVADDLLDLQGVEDERGKPHGIDWQQRRATLPLLYALEHAPAKTAREMRLLWEEPTCTPEHITALQHAVDACGGFEYGWGKVKEYQDAAVACLETLPEGPAHDALFRICRDSFPLPVMPTAV